MADSVLADNAVLAEIVSRAIICTDVYAASDVLVVIAALPELADRKVTDICVAG